MQEKNQNRTPNIVHCDGGLANRLNEIIFAFILRNKFNCDWTVLWPLTNVCRAPLNLLFNIRAPVIENPIHNHTLIENGYSFVIHHNFGGYPENSIKYHASLNNLAEYQDILESGHPIYYMHNLIPAFADISDIRDALEHITPVTTVKQKADEFCIVNKIDKNTIGLHIRKTDFGNKVDDEELFNNARKSQNHFFVCSDDEGVNAKFATLPNCSVFKKQSYPTKIDTSLGWGAASFKAGNESNMIYNLERPALSVQEALIDLLILSRTSIVRTSHSTYLNMAHIFSNACYF